MAAPAILSTYPNDDDTGIPTGISPYVIFDRGIDIETAKRHVVLYGADFDTTSGPDSAQWINDRSGENPFFLRSPGFHGIVECEYALIYVDENDEELDPQPEVVDEAAEVAGPYRCKLVITPANPLAPNVEYTLHIIGDPDSTDTGISSRTVFDVVADPGNSSETGGIELYGGYTGGNDTLNVEVTTSGDIGTAKYKWWYTSGGSGSAVYGRVTSRRYRKLSDGLQIRFTGSGFVDDDVFTASLETPTRLATSHTLSFTTNDGSYTAVPASPSTPATSSPPSSILPDSVSDTTFYVVESDPSDGASHQPLTTRTMTITFSTAIDGDTVTDSTVTVKAYPVSGVYADTYQPIELNKKLTVSGTTLTIEI